MLKEDLEDLEATIAKAQRYLTISSSHSGTDEMSRQRHFEAIGAAKADLCKAAAQAQALIVIAAKRAA